MREISFFEDRLCLAVQLQKNRNFYLVVPFCFFLAPKRKRKNNTLAQIEKIKMLLVIS
jgi:hypothetical protein